MNRNDSQIPDGARPKSGGKSPFKASLCVVGLVMIVLAWRLVANRTRLPSDTEALVRKLSSAQIIEKPVVVNHAEKLFCVAHTTENGVGVFLVNAKTKEERKLEECTSADYSSSRLNLLGWSPDDRWFAFSMDDVLRFCDGTSGEQLATVDLPSKSKDLPNRIRSFVWLTPQHCAYLDEDAQLCLLRKEGAVWLKMETRPLSHDNGLPRSLVALNTNVLAWHSDNCIWNLDLATGKTGRLLVEESNRVESMSFSKSAEALLLTERTTNRPVAYLLGVVAVTNGGLAGGFEEWTRGPSILDARWINQGKGYVYRAKSGDDSILVLKHDPRSASRTFFSGGNVWNVFADGESPRAYAVAAKNSEPVGLWVCESGADEPKCAVSPWGKEPMNLHFQPALTGNAIYGDRHSARFTVVPPANFSRQKKYPMVIGTSFYEWAPIAHGVYAQALAHSGAFVVLVNYRWDQSRPETIFNHTNNVLAVYDQMVANPCIDKNRVYLFGFSAGTMVVHELVKDYPGRWRGIMLMNAGWLPNPKEGMVGQVLMTAGSTENQDARFRHYQDELCRIGIPASWYIHAGEQHVVRSQRAFYDRTMLMLNMVFEK